MNKQVQPFKVKKKTKTNIKSQSFVYHSLTLVDHSLLWFQLSNNSHKKKKRKNAIWLLNVKSSHVSINSSNFYCLYFLPLCLVVPLHTHTHICSNSCFSFCVFRQSKLYNNFVSVYISIYIKLKPTHQG